MSINNLALLCKIFSMSKQRQGIDKGGIGIIPFENVLLL